MDINNNNDNNNNNNNNNSNKSPKKSPELSGKGDIKKDNNNNLIDFIPLESPALGKIKTMNKQSDKEKNDIKDIIKDRRKRLLRNYHKDLNIDDIDSDAERNLFKQIRDRKQSINQQFRMDWNEKDDEEHDLEISTKSELLTYASYARKKGKRCLHRPPSVALESNLGQLQHNFLSYYLFLFLFVLFSSTSPYFVLPCHILSRSLLFCSISSLPVIPSLLPFLPPFFLPWLCSFLGFFLSLASFLPVSFSFFLPSFLLSFFLSFLGFFAFLASFLPSFLGFFLSFYPSFLSLFLSSFLPWPPSLASFLPSLAFFYPWLPSFLPCFLPWLPSSFQSLHYYISSAFIAFFLRFSFLLWLLFLHHISSFSLIFVCHFFVFPSSSLTSSLSSLFINPTGWFSL